MALACFYISFVSCYYFYIRNRSIHVPFVLYSTSYASCGSVYLAVTMSVDHDTVITRLYFLSHCNLLHTVFCVTLYLLKDSC